MTTPRVLVLAHEPGRCLRLVASLERAGLVCDVATLDAADGRGTLPHRLVIVALPPTPTITGLAHLAALAQRVPDDAQVVVIARHASLGGVVEALTHRPVMHVLVGTEADVEVSLELIARKLRSGDIFGIEKHLPPGTDVQHMRLDDFAGRGRAVDAVLLAAQGARMRRQVRTAVAQVCEELLMNALYDAPVDESGAPLFAEVDPHERVRARSPRPVSIRYAATDDMFVVAVRDRYGLLAKNTITGYLDKCLRSAEQIDRKTYGAGLGLYLVASTAAAVIVNVARGVATEVICTFDRGAKGPLRQLSLCLHGGDDAGAWLGPTPASANASAMRRPITEPVMAPIAEHARTTASDGIAGECHEADRG